MQSHNVVPKGKRDHEKTHTYWAQGTAKMRRWSASVLGSRRPLHAYMSLLQACRNQVRASANSQRNRFLVSIFCFRSGVV